MNIKIIVLNNHELGKISKEQRAGNWDVWATDLINPDFAAYTTSCGALGVQVSEKAAVSAALQQVLAHHGPALLEVKTDVGLI